MSEERNGSGSIIAAFLLGGVIGAALGVLLAPKAGKDTRRDLNRWFDDTVEKGKDSLEHMGQKVADEFKHRKEQLAQAFKKENNA